MLKDPKGSFCYDNNMKIIIPDKIHFSPPQLGELESLGAEVFDSLPNSEDELARRICDAEIITANYVDITPRVIDAAKNLKYIIAPSVGFEWIDAEYAASKGIQVLNCPSFNSNAVAELAIGLALTISRKILEANSDLRSGGWDPQTFVGTELSGKELGLIGHGNIGKLIEQKAKAFGMTVSYVDSKTSSDLIDKIISKADYLVLCAQLNDKTRHMIDGRRMALMKSSSFLINVARGAIVDQEALLEALEAGSICGAALDVFEGEPLTGTPSSEIVKLAKLQNVIGTPHIGASTNEANIRLGDEILANIDSIFNGKPRNVVN
jgi:D-3-phosphoglycerate dehydrogenase